MAHIVEGLIDWVKKNQPWIHCSEGILGVVPLGMGWVANESVYLGEYIVFVMFDLF
jgi:hypothetical protein